MIMIIIYNKKNITKYRLHKKIKKNLKKGIKNEREGGDS